LQFLKLISDLPVKKDQGDIRENSHLIHARVKIESSKYGYKKQLIENTPKIIAEKNCWFCVPACLFRQFSADDLKIKKSLLGDYIC
jgi:hypothetical protein